MKKIIVFMLLCFAMINVNALSYKGCDYKSVSDMKELVNNVNISYNYHIKDGIPYFNVTINNITPQIYFVDSYNNKIYTYNDTNNGEITINDYNNSSGRYSFYSNNSNCKDIDIGFKYYKFPIYNIYYKNDICNEYKNLNICQKWVEKKYSYEEIVKGIGEYKKSLELNKQEVKTKRNITIFDKIIEIYIKYYYFVLPTIILICFAIIIINKKKNKFKL